MTAETVAAPGAVRRRFSRQFFALRLAFGVICLLLAGGVVWSAAHWSERRGVFDDIGYLRQAHLFKRFGIAGLNTDIKLDDDHFFRDAAAEIRHIAWSDPSAPAAFMHTFIPKTGAWVLQYPPGTGALLALFPEGHQAAGLYTSSALIVLGVALILILRAASLPLVILSGLFGCLSIYFMNNPAKASYSVAPSFALCAVMGLLTPLLFSESGGRRLAVAGCIGLLLGFGVNLRIANVLLAGGFGAGCLFEMLRSRFQSFKAETGLLIGAMAVGVSPTLVANAINAGSPFSTTYGAADASPPDFTFSVVPEYFRELQGALLVLSSVCVWLLYTRGNLKDRGATAIVAAVNIITNSAFFFTHTLHTPYYLMPGVMLSLWIVLASAVIGRPTSQ
jgi:hypothetical protein